MVIPVNARPRISSSLGLLILLLALVATACGTLEVGSPDAQADSDHDHEGDDHDDATEGAHDHDDEGLEIDHHGNPVRPEEFYGSVTVDGLTFEFTMQSFLGIGGRGSEVSTEIVEGTASSVVFRATDASTGAPVEGLQPAAWIDLVDPGAGTCREQIEGYASGNPGQRPLVDFNTFFLLTLNDDPTISVIDPNIDVGGMTSLYTAIILSGRGEDWGMAAGGMLAVSIPERRQVAVVDTEIFAVMRHVDIPGTPVTVIATPDDATAWVTFEDDGGGGVAAIDTDALELQGVVMTGAGPHDLAPVADEPRLLVTNAGDRSISLVDTNTNEVVSTLPLDQPPISVSYSDTHHVALVTTAAGELLVIDQTDLSILSTIRVANGAARVWIAPDQTWAIVLDFAGNRAVIVNVSNGDIVAVVDTVDGPFELTYVEEVAYVAGENSPALTSIDLSPLTNDDAPTTLELEAGQLPPSAAGVSALASSLAPIDGGGLLIANPADDMVYLHSGGSGAPLGAFQGHGLRPRSALALDRRLTETAPGVFTGRFRVPVGGDYQAAVYLSDPELVHCFTFTADSQDTPDTPTPVVQVSIVVQQVPAGTEAVVRLRLVNGSTGVPVDGVEDIQVQVSATGGNWHAESAAEALGRDGEHAFAVTLPKPGQYQILVAAPSLGIGSQNLALLYIESDG